jgi:type VI secretion system protein ImpH
MDFAPTPLAGWRKAWRGAPPWLAVHFFGLFGPNGPLPLHLTSQAFERIRGGDPTLAAFADLFHHRLLSLFYRAWADAQPAVQFDRPTSDRFAVYVGSTFGLASPGLRDRDAMPDLAKLHYAGRLAHATKNEDALRDVLADFFGLPVAVEPFAGEWLHLPLEWSCRLGESEETGTLGRTLTVGSRVWEVQHRFRVRLGPLRLDDYVSLMPGSDRHSRLAAIVRNVVGDALSWELVLVLLRDEVPALRLGGSGRLGLTTWLSSRTPDRDPDDLHLRPEENVA